MKPISLAITSAGKGFQSDEPHEPNSETVRFAYFVSHGFRIIISTASRVLLAVVAGGLIAQGGCARSASPSTDRSSVESAQRVLSAGEAAELAARLANEQCERLFRKRPFKPEQQEATLSQEGRYRWGGLDVGAPGGFSALVTFRRDGSEPHVEVYFSTDALRPPGARVQSPTEVSPKAK